MIETADPGPTTGTPRLLDLGVDPSRPLVLVDVDEVLGLFLKAFVGFLNDEGVEFRLEGYRLFQNMFHPGGGPVALPEAKTYYDRFFSRHCAELEPTPGAAEALEKLSRNVSVVVLSNAPAQAERLRVEWLRRHGLAYPLLLNEGPKGPITARLAAQVRGRTAFVDDLIPHLDSVAEHSPQTVTFQHVADERLRPLAPRSERHIRIDDWLELGEAIRAALAG